MRKLIPEPRTWLNCVKPTDVAALRVFLEGKPVSGHLVIDEFQVRADELARDVANLIKITCDDPAGAAKITVIGVNDSGTTLFPGEHQPGWPRRFHPDAPAAARAQDPGAVQGARAIRQRAIHQPRRPHRRRAWLVHRRPAALLEGSLGRDNEKIQGLIF